MQQLLASLPDITKTNQSCGDSSFMLPPKQPLAKLLVPAANPAQQGSMIKRMMTKMISCRGTHYLTSRL